MIKTDILIIGAGPVGLFAVFEAGLMKLRCHLIDSIPIPGGQLSEIYPKKPIYDIPGIPSILAGELIRDLIEQAKPFKPGFTLGERAEIISKSTDGSFDVTTNKGTKHNAKIIFIAGGLGCFEPRKPKIQNIDFFENKGVNYIIKEPKDYKGKRIFISGGGDSALDWVNYFAEKSNTVGLVHRSTNFRAHKDSVSKMYELRDQGKVELYTNSEVMNLFGSDKLKTITIKDIDGNESTVKLDNWFPLFGLSPKLGPIANWNLEIANNAIKVDNTLDYQTSIEGIYAIGDINTYPGKLKLILCGFHEATLAVQSAYKKIFPDKKVILKYTTVQGIHGFD